jgi:hypothetical protein
MKLEAIKDTTRCAHCKIFGKDLHQVVRDFLAHNLMKVLTENSISFVRYHSNTRNRLSNTETGTLFRIRSNFSPEPLHFRHIMVPSKSNRRGSHDVHDRHRPPYTFHKHNEVTHRMSAVRFVSGNTFVFYSSSAPSNDGPGMSCVAILIDKISRYADTEIHCCRRHQFRSPMKSAATDTLLFACRRRSSDGHFS